mmetsp:Transcript_33863/g.109404  ORF Transcript_33863/g.109404 Transcript_33863/m.109404 type:complete len:253 (+) Transcript_33863:646-1404(+)|eukprot:scaffold16094_cov124-Isochrysis_galbana.AAC.2
MVDESCSRPDAGPREAQHPTQSSAAIAEGAHNEGNAHCDEQRGAGWREIRRALSRCRTPGRPPLELGDWEHAGSSSKRAGRFGPLPSRPLKRVALGAWRLLPTLEDEALLRGSGRQVLVLLLQQSKVGLEDVHSLLEDVLVVVLLKLLQLLQPVRLVHIRGVRVGARHGAVRLPRLEYVLDALERHRHQAWIVAHQQVAQRLDAPLRHQVLDLLVRAARRGIRDGPRRLLFYVKLGGRKQEHERRHNVCVDD